ncbi:MAG: outer membrane lipoprotein carrier protein LolA [Deltaproteobacteria bacterium]|nr:outer membrane lipoprotein carrier protein LolA [Deltaproteobacteria bacterium]
MLILQTMTDFLIKSCHRGKLFLALCVIPALVLPGTTVLSQTLSSDELTAKIQTEYDHTADFKANFIQEATVKSIDRTTREEGTVYLKKPERMLWDYTKPSMKKLVINPRKAWLYIPDDNIVYVQDAKKVLSSKMTIRFFTGIGRLKDDFEIAFPDSGPMDTKGNYVMALKPRGYEAGIKALLITVDKDNFRIIKCVFTDMYDNITRLIFSNIKFNINPPDELFDFTPPPGVEIHNIQGQ